MSGKYLSILFCIQVSLISQSIFAENKTYSVFDVRKNLPLSNSEPSLRDFYLNMGTEQGVKPGAIINVYRRVPIVDVYRNQAQDDLVIQIGRLRVIHAQASMSVARAYRTSKRELPIVPFESVMIGDRVELSQADQGDQNGDSEEPADPANNPSEPKKDPIQSSSSPSIKLQPAPQKQSKKPTKNLTAKAQGVQIPTQTNPKVGVNPEAANDRTPAEIKTN